MRLALLDIDRDTLPLAERIAQSTGHEIVWYSASEEMLRSLAILAPRARAGGDWELLLDGQLADAAIVGRAADSEVRADRLRKLIQAGVPLMVAHPAHPSMLVCYELEMIRQSSGSLVFPYDATRYSTAVARLAEMVRQQRYLGSLEQMIFERWLADRTAARVCDVFAQDMELAQLLAGDLTRLAAMAPTSEPEGYANLGVQLSGPSNILVRWSVAPPETSVGGRLTIIGNAGRATLHMPGDGSPWRLDTVLAERSGIETFAPADGAGRALETFSTLQQTDADGALWSAACRAVELADSIQRSLEKGRTVELHSEDYTEESTFKGTMTSVGCGLLWLSFLVLVVGVIAAGFGLRLAERWPMFLLIILAVFLLLQLLRLAIPSRPSE